MTVSPMRTCGSLHSARVRCDEGELGGGALDYHVTRAAPRSLTLLTSDFITGPGLSWVLEVWTATRGRLVQACCPWVSLGWGLRFHHLTHLLTPGMRLSLCVNPAKASGSAG